MKNNIFPNLSELFNGLMNTKFTHTEQDASYAVEIDGDCMTIAFEWSNGATDWKNNLDFPAKPYRNMESRWYCHRGFLRVWKAVEPRLRHHIMNPAIKHILITGYSHGAALALLCHEYCRYHRLDCFVVGFGFGGPRVIWGPMSDVLRFRLKRFYVVRNKGDVVTHLPPAIFGFRHAPGMVEIGQARRYNSVDAHRQDAYIAELEREEAEQYV